LPPFSEDTANQEEHQSRDEKGREQEVAEHKDESDLNGSGDFICVGKSPGQACKKEEEG
jgi:hypothetical protein